MKKLNKVTAAFTAVTLTAGLAACQSNTATDGKPTDTSDKPGQTITYKILRSNGVAEYPADGGRGRKEIVKALDKAGIKGIDFTVNMPGTGPDYTTKLNLLATSGDLPDYFNLDLPTMAKMADDGLLLPLDDYIKKMPHASKLFKESDLEALRYKGKLYALPVGYRPEPFNGPNTNGFIVRKDWLDTLGLKEPTTLDELHDVLKAFTTGDPDKNGKNDSYGLGGTKTSNFSGIFGAFGIAPTFWFERDGRLKQGMVLPETKDVLKLMNQWYKEGLIDPEFLLMESKQRDEKVINSKLGVFEGTAFDIDPKQPLINSLKKVTPNASFALLLPPKGPKGLMGWPEAGPAYGDIKAVSAKVKNPDLLIKMIDWSTSDEPDGGFYLITYGMEGEHYTFDKQKNRVTQLVSSYSDLYKEGFSNPVRFTQVVDRRWMADDSLKAMEVTNKYVITNPFWKTVPAQLEYPDIIKLWTEYFAKIVLGEMPLDKFDEFVQKYYQQGGKKIEDQVNEEWKKTKK
ncbi:extracellular solute-binding protein [Paenibacillus sp. UNC451MF]|uniref:extracellular solute-binding protein n=1 Tax=Paenibacillus sp. UNC451MF TaxID=1449063 RepID=UPI00048C5111|nr:extracellular solute-binding protein [Paenibacillus sp. UNC451MF]